MMKWYRWIITYLNFWRIIPAFVVFKLNRFRKECEEDLAAWAKYTPELSGRGTFLQLGYLLVHLEETRNIFLNRLHRNMMMYVIIRILFPPLKSFYINMPPENIGGGFSAQHGFSTVVTARKIGKNFRVFQQVTVGYRGEGSPVIGDNVVVTAGAIVIGDISVGDRAKIGAGAVVVHDVPAGATVVSEPSRVIKIVAVDAEALGDF